MLPPGVQRLAPGVYVDGPEQNRLHLVIPELLAAAGYADTPENRETLIRACTERLRVGTTVTLVEE